MEDRGITAPIRDSSLMDLRVKHRKNCESCLDRSVLKSLVYVFLSVLSVVILSRDGCQMCPQMTCLKRCKFSMVAFVRKSEFVHKQVGGCLISYNLQLACVKKLEVIWPCKRIAASITLNVKPSVSPLEG